MPKVHRVFEFPADPKAPVEDMKFLYEIPFDQDDPNQGLPAEFFEGKKTNFEIDRETDIVEWVPAMGPAPIWTAKYSDFKDDAEMLRAWEAWAEETF